MRLILFTGAGGAGVTTLAAATAALVAAGGTPALLLGGEAEPLDAALGPSTERPPGLELRIADAESALGENAGGALTWLGALLAWGGLDAALLEDLGRL